MSAVRVLVVGGLSRLEAFYRDVPGALGDGPGLVVDCANEDCPSLEARALASHGLVLVLAHLSHPTAAKVRSIARRRAIPLVTSPGSSVSRVRAAIAGLWLEATNRAPPAPPGSAPRALAS